MMSATKIGDKFIIEIGEIFKGINNATNLYRIKGFKSLVFDTQGIDKLKKYDDDGIECSYQKGLNDAWATAKKVMLAEEDGGLSFAQLYQIFNTDKIKSIFNYTAEQVIKKIEEYEKIESEIRVGDVVKDLYGRCGVVVQVGRYEYKVFYSDLTTIVTELKTDIIKTGRHLDEVNNIINVLDKG